MTSPPQQVRVRCPSCAYEYDDWFRPSLNLAIENLEDDYVREATTATCPRCGMTVHLGSIIVGADGVWALAG